MERLARCRLAIAAGALAALADGAAAQEATQPAMVVRAYNYADVPSATLSRARDKAVRAFHEAGVEIVWLDVVGDLAHPVETIAPASVFTVRILIRPRRLKEPMSTREWVMGGALSPSDGGGLLYLFYEQILRVARTYQVPIEDVLALTIAHEIGHLVLPYPAHSETGIMRDNWYAGEIRFAIGVPLKFSPSQAAHIRAKVGGCCRR